jgi:hypothetical protein
MTEADSAEVYEASKIKRRRATKAEMEERAEFLIDYASEHGPVTVRQLYYQAEVHGLPGIDKTASGYTKIQAQVLSLRREGSIDYGDIADMTRWMRKPQSFNGVETHWPPPRDSTARRYGPTPTPMSRFGARRMPWRASSCRSRPNMTRRLWWRGAKSLRLSAMRRLPLVVTMTGHIMSTTLATLTALVETQRGPWRRS